MTTIEARLASALGMPMTATARVALDARVQGAIAASSPVRRTRLPFRRSLVLAVVLLALPTVLVGAAILSTEDPNGLATPAEFATELDVAKAAVPLPGGREWPAFLRVDGQAGAYSRGGGRSWVEAVATCEWFDEWLDARAAGGAVRVVTAANAIAAIPTWPSWNSQFWTQSVRDHLSPLLADVAAGHEGPIRVEMATNCNWLVAP